MSSKSFIGDVSGLTRMGNEMLMAMSSPQALVQAEPTTAVKNDLGKLRYDLIPAVPLEKLAEVYTIGAKKYSERNWEKGFKYGRIFGAMMRHAWAWWRGERNDPADGQHHLASVAWCAFALIEFETTHSELDDRVKA